MPKGEFWDLCPPDSTRKRAEWNNDEIELEKVRCRINRGHRRGGKRLSDLSVLLPRGPLPDFVWTWYSECLLQEHVLELFRAEGFTGFDVKPVQARFKDDGPGEPARFWELLLTGWAGLARPESGITRTEFCEGCKFVHYSGLRDATQLLDEAQWDGSDFFMLWPMPRHVFVTARVVDSIRAHRLKGVTPMPMHDMKQDPALIDGYGPGCLSYWMPEESARERGESSGIAEI